jgi:hypothetical protein
MYINPNVKKFNMPNRPYNTTLNPSKINKLGIKVRGCKDAIEDIRFTR